MALLAQTSGLSHVVYIQPSVWKRKWVTKASPPFPLHAHHRTRMGSILLQGATVTLEDRRFCIVTSTKHKHYFSGRSNSVVVGLTRSYIAFLSMSHIQKAWVEAIEAHSKKSPEMKELFSRWKKGPLVVFPFSLTHSMTADTETKDLINCLPRQAFAEKIIKRPPVGTI